MEQWRDIPGFEGTYAVSDQGQVKRIASSRQGSLSESDLILRPGRAKSGYMTVALKQKTFTVHRLVMLAFVGSVTGKEVNHINADRTDNRLENLEWVTRLENNQHAINLGRANRPKGESHFRSKLTAEKVVEIRDLYHAGVPQKALADMFNISFSTVYFVATRRTWKHVE